MTDLRARIEKALEPLPDPESTIWSYAVLSRAESMQSLLREVLPLIEDAERYRAEHGVTTCNCGTHRRGSLTAGWHCPFHGQQW